MSWELFNTILNYISGPVVGAIIGLVTNYLAVRMLFHPYKPFKIFGVRLPFTPGIVPKRKDALAHGIGLAVGEDLFTGEDLKALLCTERVESKLIDSIQGALQGVSSRSIDELISRLSSEEKISEVKDKLSLVIAEKLISSAQKMDIADIIAKKGKEAIDEKKSSLGMLGMFLSDGIVDPLLEQVKDKVTSFLDDEGVATALPAVRDEVDIISSTPINEQIDLSVLDTDKLRGAIVEFYESAVSKAIDSLSGELDICSVVEKKVKEMPIRDLELLCLKIMKRELRALVILGGIIGFVIGIINIFI